MVDIKNGAFYDPFTGEVIKILSCGSNKTLLLQADNFPDLVLYQGMVTFENYFDISQDPPTLEIKQEIQAEFDKTSIAADGVDAATITGLPVPCIISVDDIPYDVASDGTFIFSANSAGDYIIKIDILKFLPKEWVINAN